jgi:hypothetical protein
MEDTFNEELWVEPEQNEPTYTFAGNKRANLKDLYKELGEWYEPMF